MSDTGIARIERCSECGKSAVASLMQINHLRTKKAVAVAIGAALLALVVVMSVRNTASSTANSSYQGSVRLVSVNRIVGIGWPWKWGEWQVTSYEDEMGNPVIPEGRRSRIGWLGLDYYTYTTMGAVPAALETRSRSLPSFITTREIHIHLFAIAAILLCIFAACLFASRTHGWVRRARARRRMSHHRCPCCGYTMHDALREQIEVLNAAR